MNNMCKPILLPLAMIAMPVALASAQQSPQPAFEVASVRLNRSGESSANILPRRGGFSAVNMTLMQLVRFAFQIQEFQVTKQTSWFNTERYDIEAKAPAGRDAEKGEVWQGMLQDLLAKRFKLAYHVEQRQQDVYELTVARSGHKLKRARLTDCVFPTPGECGFRASLTQIVGDQVSMDALATRLSRSIGQPVLNKTNLEGVFDLLLQWKEDPRGSLTTNTSLEERLSIFTALQDQLGLRLEATKAPVDVYVIDHVERPSDN